MIAFANTALADEGNSHFVARQIECAVCEFRFQLVASISWFWIGAKWRRSRKTRGIERICMCDCIRIKFLITASISTSIFCFLHYYIKKRISSARKNIYIWNLEFVFTSSLNVAEKFEYISGGNKNGASTVQVHGGTDQRKNASNLNSKFCRVRSFHAFEK